MLSMATSRLVGIIAMGVDKEVLRAGKGPKPSKGQSVTVHCTGFGETPSPHAPLFLFGFAPAARGLVFPPCGKNGDLSQKFWSTKDPGQQPFTFQIGMGSVIKGWDEGVMDMQVGEVARLQCSPDYAYGPSGFPSWGIQPDSPLVFEIEVLSVK